MCKCTILTVNRERIGYNFCILVYSGGLAHREGWEISQWTPKWLFSIFLNRSHDIEYECLDPALFQTWMGPLDPLNLSKIAF